MLGNRQTALRAPVEKSTEVPRDVQHDDLGAPVIKALIEQSRLDSTRTYDLLWGWSDQAGDDTRKVQRKSTLIIGLPSEPHASTINRLCGLSLDSIIKAPNTIWSANAIVIVAGCVESMSQAPHFLPKIPSGSANSIKADNTTLSWRYPNPNMQELFSFQSMGEKAEYEFVLACHA